MIKQIKYFQAVIRFQSFTKAAEECFISQSAISQQIQSLEKELGVALLQREKKSFKLTAAGEHFYRKSLVLVSDYDRLVEETVHLANGARQEITVGYLRHYWGKELKRAIRDFQQKTNGVQINLVHGTHEELYEYLRSRKADIVVSDLRRAPSDQYVNRYLTKGYIYAEVSLGSPLAQMDAITMEELKNTPGILIAPKSQAMVEEAYCREYLGAQNEFLFAETVEEAHLMVVSGQGYFLTDFCAPPPQGETVKFLPIIRDGEQMFSSYYAFWRVDTVKSALEDFAACLQEHFSDEAVSASQKNKDGD